LKQRLLNTFAAAALLGGSTLGVYADNRPTEQSSESHKSSSQGYHHRFENAQKWSKVFDDPARDVWQKPDQVLASLKLRATDKIADIGAGTGYFSVRLANAVPAGKVFAVDTESDMVKYLSQLAKDKKLSNLVPVKADPNNANLPEKVNLVLIVDTLHHIDSRVHYLARLKRELLPHSRLVVVDFNQSSKVGPPLEHRLLKQTVVDELKESGYQLEEDLDYLPNQYFLVFRMNE
jgi:ubiquinone/menaquinone biosynthesis C-methylase UbiE